MLGRVAGLAVLLVSVSLVVPSTALADHHPVHEEMCEAGWGLEPQVTRDVFVCVEVDTDWPSIESVHSQVPQPPYHMGYPPCPGESRGWIFTFENNTGGLCVLYDVELPRSRGRTNASYSITACHTGGEEGTDPTVWFRDGHVTVCVFPFAQTSLVPAQIDLDPCTRNGIDPSVTFGDGGIFICVRAGAGTSL